MLDALIKDPLEPVLLFTRPLEPQKLAVGALRCRNRNLTEEEIAFISQSAVNYVNLAEVHAAENAKSFDEIEFEKALRKKFARIDEEYDSMLGVVKSHQSSHFLITLNVMKSAQAIEKEKKRTWTPQEDI
ncbi:uncharacterized protein A4U43_C05F20970 [Asparagus officinalis]|uniref:Uncharacterized protein n=1 Tax=Asparagus officinalis TaxID=4686 RepID=A0A5P1EVR4_ASPOF|nr:uncharacterized protein A4U43_C05F20970 [Asparagus officinalis]